MTKQQSGHSLSPAEAEPAYSLPLVPSAYPVVLFHPSAPRKALT